MTALAPTLQAFFTDRLALQRQASGHTVAAYRDALRMLIAYAAQRAGKAPSRLDIADLDAQTAGAFLDHLENERGNSARTRNARLAAIHSLFQYAAVRHPEHAADIQRVLAIPPKRYDKALITYLTEDEITALLAAPDLATWTGRRDQALLVLVERRSGSRCRGLLAALRMPMWRVLACVRVSVHRRRHRADVMGGWYRRGVCGGGVAGGAGGRHGERVGLWCGPPRDLWRSPGRAAG